MAGVMAALYAMLIHYDAQLLTTWLEVFLDLALIGLLIAASEKPKFLNWFLCGVVLGLSAITRPNLLILVPFILIWLLFRFRKGLGYMSSQPLAVPDGQKDNLFLEGIRDKQ